MSFPVEFGQPAIPAEAGYALAQDRSCREEKDGISQDASAAARPAARRLTAAVWLLAAMAVALGVFFRISHLDQKPIWDDEVVTWMHFLGVSERELVEAAPNMRHVSDLREVLHPTTVGRPVSYVIKVLLEEDQQHPPIYYMIAHEWVSLFDDSVRSVRLLSAMIGLLAIPCMYWLCIELFGSPAAGLIGAGFIALSPVAVLYSQEAREYSLWLVCILIVSALYSMAFRTTRLREWGLYCAALTFSLYVFPLTACVAGAHLIVGLCTRTSMRNRINSIFAICVAVILFSPWLLVILTHLSQVNASMHGVVNAKPFQLHTLLGTLRFLHQDVIDFNGAHWLFVQLATILIVPLLAYAIYDVRQVNSEASRLFVWALLCCSALPLIGMDLVLGGHRSDTTRYLIPAFLGLDLTMVALFSQKLTDVGSSMRLLAWQGVFVLVITMRFASCAQSAMAPTWWDSYNIQSRQVATKINAIPHALIISDDYILWPLVLAEYLNPSFDVALRPRCYLCKLPGTAPIGELVLKRSTLSQTVVLVAPSEQLLTTTRAAMAADGAAASLSCVDVRGSCPDGLPMWSY